MYTTYEEARDALDAAENDVRNDMGEEALEAGYHDVVESVASECTIEVAIELFRTTLGWVPTQFADRNGLVDLDCSLDPGGW